MSFESNNIIEDEISTELIDKLEKQPIDPLQKADLLLVEAGIKPASLITITNKIWSEGEEPHVFMEEDQIITLEEMIRKMNVLFQAIPITRKIAEIQKSEAEKVKVYADEVDLLVGATGENLERLSEAYVLHNHELLGRAVGIPETAIEAFLNKRDRLDLRTLPKNVLLSEEMTFSTPTLSRDNWKEEVETGRVYANYLKKFSPHIYSELMNMRQKVLEQWGLLPKV